MAEDPSGLIIEGLSGAGIDFVASLPDSRLGAVQERLKSDARFKVVQVTNEGEGLAVCAGAWLGGKKPALIMENTGFLLATYAMDTVCAKLGVPVLLVMSDRGELGDALWWFAALGERFRRVLRSMSVRYTEVKSSSQIKRAIMDAWSTSQTAEYPTAVLLSKEALS